MWVLGSHRTRFEHICQWLFRQSSPGGFNCNPAYGNIETFRVSTTSTRKRGRISAIIPFAAIAAW
jgi:hypothetical protein